MGTRVADLILLVFSGRSGAGLGLPCQHASVLPALEVHVNLFLSWGRRWEGANIKGKYTVRCILYPEPESPGQGPQALWWPPASHSHLRVVLGVAASHEDSAGQALSDTAVRRDLSSVMGRNKFNNYFCEDVEIKASYLPKRAQWKVNLGSFSHTSGLKEKQEVLGYRDTGASVLASERLQAKS